ncbi:uncharacterized protein IUM83_03827 [Phytophthora cinnamomi]|uniref:uncharacterized protein n=1 Tax=Phytophthora cinnamomi TaxID=4785 RepID=UPI00355ACB9F|nr:hypothetical protein IUM83_03827 [Phytophthora cinnamomi]
MRELFARFPEVVMIDATHGTNLSKYKVFSIMAHDAFGKGQFVQHAVIQNERNPTLLTALEQFKRYNPAWSRIKCILIDKDFGEISVLKKTFPDAMLLLCQFHVLKYLREQIASKDYGFNAWQKQQLNGLINLLVYAKTERQCLRLREYMRHIIDVGTGRVSAVSAWSGGIELGTSRAELGIVGGARDECKHPFEAYFVKNWLCTSTTRWRPPTLPLSVLWHQMNTMLPDGVRPSARLVTHDPGLGVQSDSYNCGVYVLLAFEMFCGSEPLGHLDKKTLQCMRYRYLRMCMNEERSSSS